jgi:hypothetical protein
MSPAAAGRSALAAKTASAPRCCTGCTLPILFDPLELEAVDPAPHEVMCAWCGTVTSRGLVISQAYDPSGAAALPPRG